MIFHDYLYDYLYTLWCDKGLRKVRRSFRSICPNTLPLRRVQGLWILRSLKEKKKATPPEPKSQDVGIENSLKYVRCFQHLV